MSHTTIPAKTLPPVIRREALPPVPPDPEAVCRRCGAIARIGVCHRCGNRVPLADVPAVADILGTLRKVSEHLGTPMVHTAEHRLASIVRAAIAKATT